MSGRPGSAPSEQEAALAGILQDDADREWFQATGLGFEHDLKRALATDGHAAAESLTRFQNEHLSAAQDPDRGGMLPADGSSS